MKTWKRNSPGSYARKNGDGTTDVLCHYLRREMPPLGGKRRPAGWYAYSVLADGATNTPWQGPFATKAAALAR